MDELCSDSVSVQNKFAFKEFLVVPLSVNCWVASFTLLLFTSMSAEF